MPAALALALVLGALAAPAAAAAPPLPRVSLDTQRAIRDEPKVRARMRAGDYSGWAGVEVRGQSSQRFPKKSYALELRTRSGANRNEKLLGMPEENDWVLYAPYNDKSLMRNVVGYAAARQMGRWAARTRFVHLTLNGRYRGVYVLMESVKFDGDRIDAEGDGETGRYLAELTFGYQARRKGSHFRTPVKREHIVYEEPKRDEMSRREARYLRGVVGRAERSLYRGGSRTAWRRHLDAPAAVDYVIAQELTRNADAFLSSTFLVKGAGAKLALGPVWDLDLAMANARRGSSEATRGWLTRSRVWASRMWGDASFRTELKARWRALRAGGLREAVLRAVDASAAELRPPAGRNFRRWPVLGRRVWQEPRARGSWTAEVRFLRSWLGKRIAWIDRATDSLP